MSIPDTALLIPLADLLGVTVTELLLCEKMERSAPMDADQIEHVVKTAIEYSDEKYRRAYQVKSVWRAVYVISVVLGCFGLYINALKGDMLPKLITYVVLGGIFGAYFCFFVRLKLPTYYDEHRINGVFDGPFRMHIPGISFHNGNWPHIVKVGRIWACGITGLVPFVAFLMNTIFPPQWQQGESYFLLAVVLGGLFVPLYVVAKKYE